MRIKEQMSLSIDFLTLSTQDISRSTSDESSSDIIAQMSNITPQTPRIDPLSGDISQSLHSIRVQILNRKLRSMEIKHYRQKCVVVDPIVIFKIVLANKKQ